MVVEVVLFEHALRKAYCNGVYRGKNVIEESSREEFVVGEVVCDALVVCADQHRLYNKQQDDPADKGALPSQPSQRQKADARQAYQYERKVVRRMGKQFAHEFTHCTCLLHSA
jgi:hypothetical protein